MTRVARIAFVAVGLLNLYPAIGAVGAPLLDSLYGIGPLSAELELLLRHRAVMLGIVGGLLIAAAWRPPLRPAAVAAGVTSMLAFMALAPPPDALGAALARVYWADAIGTGVLVAAAWAARVRRA
jgi:hypothetical protein